jgi:diguanylate cyclase (GGDEF)-like protein
VLCAGLTWAPDTGAPVTALCVVGLAAYLLTIGNIAHQRNDRLRETRARLQLGERAQLTANEVLRRQLEEIHQLQEKLGEQANRDPLTGLYNRRYIDATLEQELARSQRGGHPLCVVMMDIDHFKQINDTLGHVAGDACLRSIALTLQDCVRISDHCGRWGGEEFICLLPETDSAGGQEMAERLRLAVASLPLAWQGLSLHATISVGLTVRRDGEAPDALIGRADAALYRAKEAGRNCVVLSEP